MTAKHHMFCATWRGGSECTCDPKERQRAETVVDIAVGDDYDDPPEIDDRAWDDWCRAQGWDNCQDCPDCGGSGEYKGFGTFEPCPLCDGDGIIDRP